MDRDLSDAARPSTNRTGRRLQERAQEPAAGRAGAGAGRRTGRRRRPIRGGNPKHAHRPVVARRHDRILRPRRS